ncbi:CRISPR-associated endonuclease Cas3'' [Neisseria flavescens]|uniref:CRISPR-associated endonuclease Cas3'' n=1 Tax=Neisseria flavescens TaxID=484 RepID=UPI000AEE3F4D|nr:CRISPR-associated endonuclease Cas3'' [Neisseria flavescens]
MTDKIAHARQDASGNWHSHPLQDHLQKVAQLAKRFAGRYGSLFAEYAGLLHDLGKFQEAFQKYIRNASGFEKEMPIWKMSNLPSCAKFRIPLPVPNMQ